MLYFCPNTLTYQTPATFSSGQVILSLQRSSEISPLSLFSLTLFDLGGWKFLRFIRTWSKVSDLNLGSAVPQGALWSAKGVLSTKCATIREGLKSFLLHFLSKHINLGGWKVQTFIETWSETCVANVRPQQPSQVLKVTLYHCQRWKKKSIFSYFWYAFLLVLNKGRLHKFMQDTESYAQLFSADWLMLK